MTAKLVLAGATVTNQTQLFRALPVRLSSLMWVRPIRVWTTLQTPHLHLRSPTRRFTFTSATYTTSSRFTRNNLPALILPSPLVFLCTRPAHLVIVDSFKWVLENCLYLSLKIIQLQIGGTVLLRGLGQGRGGWTPVCYHLQDLITVVLGCRLPGLQGYRGLLEAEERVTDQWPYTVNFYRGVWFFWYFFKKPKDQINYIHSLQAKLWYSSFIWGVSHFCRLFELFWAQ